MHRQGKRDLTILDCHDGQSPCSAAASTTASATSARGGRRFFQAIEAFGANVLGLAFGGIRLGV
jgi:hypothetical protein